MADTVAIRVSADGVDQATARLRQLGEAGERSFQRIGAAGAFTSVQTRGQLQNIGFQLQDLVIQLEAGTPPLRAFIQQGGQILQIFGPIGAAASVVAVAIGAAASAFFGFGREVDAATAVADAHRAAQDALRGTLVEVGKSVDDLRDSYIGLSDAQRDVAGEELEAAIDAKANELESQRKQLEGVLEKFVTENPAVNAIRVIEEQRRRFPELLQNIPKGTTPRLPPGTEASLEFLKEIDRFTAGGSFDDLILAVGRLKDENEIASEGFRELANQIVQAGKDARPTEEALQKLKASLEDLRGQGSADEAFFNLKDYLKEFKDIEAEASKAAAGVARDQAAEAERAAKAYDSARERFQSFRNEVARSVSDAEDFALAANESAEAYERARESSEIRRQVERAIEDARRGGLEVSEDEANVLEAQLTLALQLKDTAEETVRARRQANEEYLRQFREIEEEANRAQEQAAEDARRQAEQEARDRARPFEAAFDRAAENIQDALANSIENAFAGEIGSVQEFADELVGVFRSAAAQIAALAIFDPKKFSELAGKVFGEQGQERTFANFATGTGIGVAAGTTLSGATGGNQTGALIGSTIGSAIGFAAFGVPGAAIGGAAGGLFGGLFGGGSGGNNRAGSRINIGTGVVSLGNDPKSAANQQVVDRIVTGLGSVVDFIKDIGGKLPKEQFIVRVGDKSGSDLTIGDRQFRFDSPEELTVEAIKRIVKAAENIPQDVRRAANRSDARTADQLIEDINFGASFAKLVNPVTALKAEFDALQQTFDQARIRAKQLGLDEQALAAARQKTTTEFLDEVKRGIASVVDPGSVFKQQLEAIKVQFDDAAKLAKDFGLSESAVQQGRQRAIAELNQIVTRTINELIVPASTFKRELNALEVQFEEAAQIAKEFGLNEQAVAQARQRAFTEVRENAREAFNSIVNPASQFGQQLAAINKSFDEAAQLAKDFGFSEDTLTRSRKLAIDELKSSARESIAALVNPPSELGAQLQALDERFAEAARLARELGDSESQVEAARRRARDELKDAARENIEALINPLSTFGQQIQEVNRQFDEAKSTARELGISEATVEAGRRRAIGRLRDEAQAAFNELIDPVQGFLGQLRDLVLRFDEASQIARDLSISEGVVADARSKAIAELVSNSEEALLSQRDQIVAAFDGLLDPIRGTIEALQFGNLTALSPQDQLEQAQTAFREQLALARRGDEDAIRVLPDLARNFATEAREFNASGQIFQDAFREINEGLVGVVKAGELRQQDILSQLPDNLARANRGVIDGLERGFNGTIEELRQLRREIAQLRLPA